MFYLFFFASSDNPLICDCDLRWYRDWLKELRHRDDDDIIQKKHILCLMEDEHRCVLFFICKNEENHNNIMYKIHLNNLRTSAHVNSKTKIRLIIFKNKTK